MLGMGLEVIYRYEKLLDQANSTVRQVMGENGILKKKFLEFQRDLDMAQDDLKEMSDQKKELYDIISCCERDIRYGPALLCFLAHGA
jgi:hypothetical protein